MQSNYVGEVRSFVVANYLLGRGDGFGSDASFLEQGIIDSTGILELVSHLEETYGIEVADEELNPDNFDSINKICAYLARKLPVPTPDQASVQGEATSLQ
ncbi:MAG: acyl carrier protein [Terriglobales bacterium]